jgi:hypothetical protein
MGDKAFVLRIAPSCNGLRLSAGGLANRAHFRLALNATEDAVGLALNATGLTFAATSSHSTSMGSR